MDRKKSWGRIIDRQPFRQETQDSFSLEEVVGAMDTTHTVKGAFRPTILPIENPQGAGCVSENLAKKSWPKGTHDIQFRFSIFLPTTRLHAGCLPPALLPCRQRSARRQRGGRRVQDPRGQAWGASCVLDKELRRPIFSWFWFNPWDA